MREIKFRVWNGLKMEHNIMVGFLGTFYVKGIDEKDSASMSPMNTKYPETTPLMQFIGLKDKNGKEIYEGDILEQAKQINGNFIDIIFTKYVVEYKNEGFTYVPIPKSLFTILPLDDLEIIGNIYQNPELIPNP